MISAGLAIGPVIVKFLGAENYSSFLASSFLVLLSFTILTPLKKMPAPQITSQKIPLAEFFKTNSRCFLGRFFLDLQCFCMLAFTVIYGKKIGLSAEDAGLLITAYMTSGFLDIFIGILIKKFNPYKLINLSFIGSLVCILIICLFHESYKLLLLTYFWFGTFGAVIYIASITITNNDYPKEKLIGANSTLQRIASSGSLCGTLLGGISIQIFGEAGFPIAIIFSCISYLGFHIFYEKKYAQKN
jgi:predicted MFS family arabinose efflux permease